MAEKRYWWLKLPDDFFQQKEIRALRKKPNGDTLIIIYLKMQLSSLRNNGLLIFDGFEDSFVNELAFQLEESESNVNDVVNFLKKHNFLIELSETNMQLPSVCNSIITETDAAKRMRNSRKNQKCNDVTKSSNTYSNNVTKSSNSCIDYVTCGRNEVTIIDKDIDIESSHHEGASEYKNKNNSFGACAPLDAERVAPETEAERLDRIRREDLRR